MRKTYLPLSDEDRNYLKSLSKKRTIQAQVVDRARILLYKADGMTFVSAKYSCGFSNLLDSSIIVNER